LLFVNQTNTKEASVAKGEKGGKWWKKTEIVGKSREKRGNQEKSYIASSGLPIFLFTRQIKSSL